MIRTNIALYKIKEANSLIDDINLIELLSQIEQEIINIRSLSEDFRSSFKSPDEKEKSEIKDIVSQAIYESCIPKNIEVLTNYEENAVVYTTKNIVEVFKNLIVNAYESMPNGGRLSIKVLKNYRIGMIEIIISDTGKGIPEFLKSSIFRPYFSTKEDTGHGLGLWWSRAYIEGLGGELTLLSSEVSKGSIFKVSLPLINN